MNQAIQRVSDFLQTLTWIDYVIAIGIGRGIVIGFKSGGFVELLRWVVLLLTLAAVVSFSGTLSAYMQSHTDLSESVSQITVIVAVGVLVFLILRLFMQLLLKFASMDNNWAMKILGVVLGGLRWAVLISFTLFALNALHLFKLQEDDLEKSRWGTKVEPLAAGIIEFAKGVVPEATFGLKTVDSDEASDASGDEAADSGRTAKTSSKKAATRTQKSEE